MPAWLIQFVLGLVVKVIEHYAAHLTDDHQQRLGALLPAYTPLKPEENPAPWKSNDPNNNDTAHGGHG